MIILNCLTLKFVIIIIHFVSKIINNLLEFIFLIHWYTINRLNPRYFLISIKITDYYIFGFYYFTLL